MRGKKQIIPDCDGRRRCTECGEWKSLRENFTPRVKRGPDKYSSHCHVCRAKRESNRRKKLGVAYLTAERERGKRKRIKDRPTKRVYVMGRYNNEIGFRIKMVLSRRIRSVLFDLNKSASTEALLGCTIDQFLGHLEINFQDGMSWENYGRNGWHIDHVRPCASFDLSDPAQQRVCFNWKNLQPLWAEENIRKGARW